MRTLEVNSLTIPGRFASVASRWYSGQSDLLYAVSSTGGLTLGNRCPVHDTDNREERDWRWYYSLWRELSGDVGYAARAAAKHDDDDAPLLEEFERYVDACVERIAEAYPELENWEEF